MGVQLVQLPNPYYIIISSKFLDLVRVLFLVKIDLEGDEEALVVQFGPQCYITCSVTIGAPGEDMAPFGHIFGGFNCERGCCL